MSLASVPAVVEQGRVVDRVTLSDEITLWREAAELAKAIAPTDFVPKALRNNPPAVLSAMLRAHELGISPLHGLSQIHVIDGRPALASELMRALILSHGHHIWTEEATQTRVVICGQRKGTEHVTKVTWTIDDAKRANLAGKPNWRTYPRQMLIARATSELARLMFADVLAGLSYSVEELSDGIDVLEPQPGDTTGPAAPKPVRTRRTKTSQRASATSITVPEPPTPLPPPLPGEPGYEDHGPGDASDREAEGAHSDTPPSPGPSTAPGPTEAPPQQSSAGPASPDPAELVAARARAIAIQARDTDVDHHHVILAVTHGAKNSAKTVTAAEADAVLHALADIRAGHIQLIEADDGWELEEMSDAKVEQYQARIQELQRLRPGGQHTLDYQGDM